MKPNPAEQVKPPAVEARKEPEIVILKIAPPPPTAAVTRPLELAQEPPRHSEGKRQEQAARVVAEALPQAPQRSSVEAENPPPTPKRDEIEFRPAPAMFRQFFSAASEITHRVIDKAKQLFERQPAEVAKPEPKSPPPHAQSEPIQLTPPEKQRAELKAMQERDRQQRHRERMSLAELQAALDRERDQARDHHGPKI